MHKSIEVKYMLDQQPRFNVRPTSNFSLIWPIEDTERGFYLTKTLGPVLMMTKFTWLACYN